MRQTDTPILRNRNRNRRPRLRRSGNALLDLAFVLPILLMLTFGAVEYGYALYVKHALQGAAREGARTAIARRAPPPGPPAPAPPRPPPPHRPRPQPTRDHENTGA